MKGFIVFLIMLLSCGKIFSQNTFAETDGVYIGAGFNVGWGGGLGNEQGFLLDGYSVLRQPGICTVLHIEYIKLNIYSSSPYSRKPNVGGLCLVCPGVGI